MEIIDIREAEDINIDMYAGEDEPMIDMESQSIPASRRRKPKSNNLFENTM